MIAFPAYSRSLLREKHPKEFLAYISNDVEIFEKNTTTIDMFGSAKYRNYRVRSR